MSGDINSSAWAEGVNFSSTMGPIKRWYNRSNATVTSGGTANAQTLTFSTAPGGLVSGDVFRFIPGASNTGAATLNVNGLGAKDIVDRYGDALGEAEIVLGVPATVTYDGTKFYLGAGNPRAPSRSPLIPAEACGMLAAATDNSTALAYGLTNFNGIIDGAGQTFKFTAAGGTSGSPGALTITGRTGRVGLRNMVLDFTACTADQYLVYVRGADPTTPVALSIDASAKNPSVFVTDVSTFSVGQFVVINSQGTWCSNPDSTTTTNEYNRITAINSGTGEITLQSRLLNDYLVSDSAVIMGLFPGGDPPLQLIMDNVHIIGAGSARTASPQYGLRFASTWRSQCNVTFANCYDFGLEASLWNIDSHFPFVRGADAAVSGRGDILLLSGTWRSSGGTAIAENCDQTLVRGSASTTIAGIPFGMVCRDSHINCVYAHGNFHSGAAVNSHSGVANSWVDYAEGSSNLNGSDGYFVTLNGYQEGIGRVVCQHSQGHVVLAQYRGGRDKNGHAWYQFGSISGTSTDNAGRILLVQGSSNSSSRPLNECMVGSILCGDDVDMGVQVLTTNGPVDLVDIGPSVIKAVNTSTGYGLFLSCGVGGYSMGKVRVRNSLIAGNGNTSAARPVYVSTGTVTVPEVILENCEVQGGDFNFTIGNALLNLQGQIKTSGSGTGVYSLSSSSLVTIYDEAPAERWSPTGSSSRTIRCSKEEILPSSTGFTLTITIPAVHYVGQEFEVAMLANGATTTNWVSPDSLTMNGFPSSMSAYSVMKARYDGSAWQRVR